MSLPREVSRSGVAGGMLALLLLAEAQPARAEVLALGNDQFVEKALPFPFPFCVQDPNSAGFQSVFVSSNGFVTFGAGSADPSPSVPELLSGPRRIAGLWTDLDPSAGGTIETSGSPSFFTISYQDVPESGSSNLNTFDIHLYPDGVFLVDYTRLDSSSGLAGRAVGGGTATDPGETDLGAAAPPIHAPYPDAVYELFAGDADLEDLLLDYRACSDPATGLLVEDDDAVEVRLPFGFSFCGWIHDTLFVGSNGFVTFGVESGDPSPSVLDLRSGPPRIVGLWTDLDPVSAGKLTARSAGADFVVDYTDVPVFNTTNKNSFSLLLRPDGTFKVVYATLDATTGLAGHSPGLGVATDPGELDLSGAPQPIDGPYPNALYELFSGGSDVEDLATRTLEYASCTDVDGDGVVEPADNCPFIANPGQQDGGGIATAQPDGIGNVCQCGDITGNGIVNGQDGTFITRHALGYNDPLYVDGGRCDVTGNGICNGQDGTFTSRAGLGYMDPLDLSPRGQNCHNANPGAPPCATCSPCPAGTCS